MQRFDVIIPYLPNNSQELEYCLKSIKNNLPHRKIHVVTVYEKSKYSELAHINQILKLKWAIDKLNVSEQFYLMNDDFFIMKPVAEIPYYHKGLLIDHYNATNWLTYKRAIKRTIEYCGEAALSYEMHIPMRMDTAKLRDLIEKLMPLVINGRCPLIRSAYGNFYKVGGEYTEDVKHSKYYQGLTYLSTNEISFKGHKGKYIRANL